MTAIAPQSLDRRHKTTILPNPLNPKEVIESPKTLEPPEKPLVTQFQEMVSEGPPFPGPRLPAPGPSPGPLSRPPLPAPGFHMTQ